MIFRKGILLFIIILALSTAGMYGEIPTVQRNALLKLYQSTNGDSWTNNSNWNGEAGSEHTWYGVYLNAEQTMVLEVSLNNNNLVGTIPAETGDLSNLTVLNLSNNSLSGTIPAELGKLYNLKVLDLHSNQLSGSPAVLTDLTNLTHLYLNHNGLSESIPAEFEKLSSLEELNLGSNSFVHDIPGNLGNLSKLQRLYLNDNRLEGAIPAALGNLSALEYLYIQGNKLAGPIPSGISQLQLVTDGSDFRWNALYTTDDSLKNYLNSRQQGGDWQSFQTTVPNNLTAETFDATTVRVSWEKILYEEDAGGYQIFYSTTPDDPSADSVTTAAKDVTDVYIADLSTDITLYFSILTFTEPHNHNDNRVVSDRSSEVSAVPSGEISISGRVLSSDGSGVADVRLTFSNNGGSTITGSGGYYRQVISPGWTGTVIPEKTGFRFNPPQKEYANVQSSQLGQDFQAIMEAYYVSGRITFNGTGLGGVTIAFSNEAGEIKSNANGYYNHPVPFAWSGEIRPTKTGFQFTPESITFSSITGNKPGQDFTALAIQPVISGRVISSEGAAVADVKMEFSNGPEPASCNAQGYFIQTVPDGWSGTLTPVKTGYWFDPKQRSYNQVTNDWPDQNFVAEGIFPRISGKIETAEGIGLSNVTLEFSNAGGNAQTGSDGRYSHPVLFNWGGKVKPSKEGWSFSPRQRPYSDVKYDIDGQDYTANPILPEISGRITISTESGILGIPDVRIDFSNNAGSAYTDQNGKYSHAVEKGWSGSVTPSKEGFAFSPTSQTYVNVQDNQDGQNYSASRASPVISGYVTTAIGSPVPGAVLNFSNNGGATTTDNNGHYSQSVSIGWTGSVSAEKIGWSFTPPQRFFENVDTNVNLNFTGSPDVSISLQASRLMETTLIMQKEYCKLEITVQLSGQTTVSKYVVYRKTNNPSEPRPVMEISGGDIPNGSTYLFYDRYLETGVEYSYEVRALDRSGVVVATSNGVTI